MTTQVNQTKEDDKTAEIFGAAMQIWSQAKGGGKGGKKPDAKSPDTAPAYGKYGDQSNIDIDKKYGSYS
jgi:hypothetical protein